MAYLALFASAFLAATLFPAQSEAALLALLASKQYSPVLLLVFASVGNIQTAYYGWRRNWYVSLRYNF